MLPFLRPKQVAGVIISKRKPDGSNETEKMEGDDSAPLNACAADLIRAVHAKDEAAVAGALRSAFECIGAEIADESEEGEQE